MHRKLFLIGSLVCVFCVILQAQTPIGPKAPFTAKDLELGKQLVAKSLALQTSPERPRIRQAPHEPFKFLGNLYFVGIGNGEVYLLTSPQGHIMFGVGYVNTTELVEKNIEALGFKLSDIKIILISYWHGDAAGGAAHFKEKTGATLMAGVADIPFIERGGSIPNHILLESTLYGFVRGTFTSANVPTGGQARAGFPPAKVDRALYDNDQIKLGPLTVTAHHVPGHTGGGMAWSYMVREGNRDYKVFQQGPTFVEETPHDIGQNPAYSEAAVRHSFETFRKLLPVDVYLASPAFGFWLEERLAKLKAGDKLAFLDRSLFPAIVAAREVEFEEAFRNAKTQ